MAKKNRYYQRPDGLFEAVRTINGKRKAFRGKSCREVDRKILEYQEQKERGRTFKAVLNEWWNEKEPTVTEATRRAYSPAMRRLEEEYGEREIKSIRPLDLERTVIRMKEQGYRQGTFHATIAIMRQVCSWAVIHGDLDISPATEIHTPKGTPAQHRQSLTNDQIRAVTEYRGAGHLLGMLLLYTGCRIGEAMALRYEDIDRKGATVTICRKVSYATGHPVMEDQTKTAAGMRTIRLLAPLADVLPKGHIGLIFHEPDGSPLTKSHYTAMWRDLCDGVGFVTYEAAKQGRSIVQRPVYPITPHVFRHTFATVCYDAGIDSKATAAMLGHSNEQTTRNIYTHLRRERQQLDAERLEEYVSSLVSTQ